MCYNGIDDCLLLCVDSCKTLGGTLMKHDVMYLKNIFVKNLDQAMRHLQFKSQAVPTKSAGTCPFAEKWMESMVTHLIGYYTQNMVYYLLKIVWGGVLAKILGRCFTKTCIFDVWKMENWFFVQRRWKLPLETLFAIARYTHVHNMRPLSQSIRWLRSWPSSSSLNAMKLRTSKVISEDTFLK